MERRNPAPRSLFRIPNVWPDLWEGFEGRLKEWSGSEDTGVTVSEDNQHVFVEAHLPGLKSDDIDISFHQNTLWIKGEKKEEESDKDKKYYRRARNSFYYQVELPTQVEENSEQADFHDGILQIVFKKTQQSQVRKISIGENKKKK